jgi:hypothetical protein
MELKAVHEAKMVRHCAKDRHQSTAQSAES